MSDQTEGAAGEIDYSQLRKHNRYNINTPCRVINENANTQVDTFLTTVSLGGVSFVYKEIIPKGTIVRIEFDMPNGSKVNKYLEIKRFKAEVKIYPTSNGGECRGFEHGGKFIALNKDSGSESSDTDEDDNTPETVIPVREEVFVIGFHHIEFLTPQSNILHHGYTTKMSDRHIFFNTLFEFHLGDKLFANIVIIEEEKRTEEAFQLEVKEVFKDGKMVQVKGGKI